MQKIESTLDEKLDKFLSEDSPSARAVNALVDVKSNDKENNFDTNVEVKTDLTSDLVRLHSAGEILGIILELNEEDFVKKNIITLLINKLERKLISKDRKSREEIVAVARQPDQQNFIGEGGARDGVMKRMFTPRK